MTTPTTHRDRLAGHLAQVENWILGAEHDVREFERQLADAERGLPVAAKQTDAAATSARAILGTGPDSVTFRSDIDREVAALEAVTWARATKTNLRTLKQAIDTLEAKLANSRTHLHQAQALKKRLELAMQVDELPSAVDELEALLED
ncbi:hypothetical protein [Streptomyces sp. NPDC003710]